MTPLPGGFPKEKAVENAASVRISRPGLDFVEQNLASVVTRIVHLNDDGNLTFTIPETDAGRTILVNGPGTWGDVSAEIYLCDGGPKDGKCQAEIGLGKATFQVDSITPNAVRVRGVIPLKLSDTPVRASVDPGQAEPVVHVGYGDGQCSGGTPDVKPYPLPITVTIPLVTESTAPRTGYTTIDVDNAVLDLSELKKDQLQICAGCAGIDYCNDILNSGFVKDKVLGALKSNIEGKVKDLLRSQLCTKPNPTANPTCPTGSSPNDGNDKCVFDSNHDKCVPVLLGTDAHIDLGRFLAKFSPSTSGGLDFGLASGGSMKPLPNAGDDAQGRTPNGITLGLVGGVLPAPPSSCVPQATLTPPTEIPLPDELAPTSPDPKGAPHVGLALSGRFLEYALGGVYNSGTLCLAVSTDQVALLKSSVLSLVIPSIQKLTFEQKDAAAAITTRPQAAPLVKVGKGTEDDPLLTLTLPKFAVDFYVWHFDRYVRVFTFEGDVTVPLNLQTGKEAGKTPEGGVVPFVGDLSVANAKVLNAELLMDSPDFIAASLTDLLGGLTKQAFGNGFSSFDASSALASFGLGMEFTDFRKIVKGKDDFVGLFANLKAASAKTSLVLDTEGSIVAKAVQPDRMQLATYARDALPELTLDVRAPNGGGEAVEYSWWIDGGSRAPWKAGEHLVVKDTQLLLQGKHVLHVAARIAGRPETEDPTPLAIPFAIDALAPFVTVTSDEGAATLRAWDLVSSSEALRARYRLDGAPFGEFRPVAELARIEVGAAKVLDVEVVDEEGNVRSVRQDLVRGTNDAANAAQAAGCGCSTVGTEGTGGTAGLAAGLLGFGIVVLRRRRIERKTSSGRAVRSTFASGAALASIVVAGAVSEGCSCGSDASDDATLTGCGSDCNQACAPPLPQGTPGAYTSVARASDGAIWVAGYNDALLNEGQSQLWGDLVVGKYDLGKERVAWTTVDGVPERTDGTCSERDKTTWRNGEIGAGDDVGLWTSLQMSTTDAPMVAYYDATHRRLKFAVDDGGGWKVSVLSEVPNGDVGRYAKMILEGGKPVIAYSHAELGNGGKTRAKIVLARATVELPHGPEDFTFEDVAVEEDNPCSAATCPAGQKCLASGVCAETTTCAPECGDDELCVNADGAPTCQARMPSVVTYPNVFGDYVSLARGPKGLVVTAYDRPRGNLVALIENGGTWTTVIADGETGNRAELTDVDTGDVGVGSSVFVDEQGTLHLSYVGKTDATLRYVSITDGKPSKPSIVDDGFTLDGQKFADGRHFIGDDSVLRVDHGTVFIYYQDATAGVLRRAIGTKTGSGDSTWSLRSIPQPGKFAGFFPSLVPGETDKIANFWRQTDATSKSVTTDVTVVTP